jgi:hypothetical protein
LCCEPASIASETLSKIAQIADSNARKCKEERLDTIQEQLVLQIKHDEFLATVERVNHVAYGNQKIVPTLYSYRLNEEIEMQNTTDEARDDYRNNRMGMLCNQRASKQPKKKRKIKLNLN